MLLIVGIVMYLSPVNFKSSTPTNNSQQSVYKRAGRMLIGAAVGSLGAVLYYKNKLQGKKLLVRSLDTGAF